MIHKVNVVKKIAFLLMTMALAGAIVACQGTVTSPATVANEIGDMGFDVGGSAKKVTLTGLFNATNPKYSANSSKESVAAVSVSGAVLTVTPTGAGTANVEVTADGDEGKVSQTFTVTVNAPTVIVNKAPTVRTISPVPLQVAGTKKIELSDHFTDPEGDALTYTAASSDDSVATVTDPGAASMITITAVADGTAKITVSASDDTNAAVSQTFTVTVTATPPPNERPVQTGYIDPVSLRVDETTSITLSDSYLDPDGDTLMYGATSGNTDVATVSGPDDMSMITITAVGVGNTTITVSATDDKSEPVRQTFKVMVGSKAPVVDASLPTNVTLPMVGNTADLNLSKYYDDPEGDTLTYTAISDTPAVAEVSDPDDMSMITITAVAPGDARITVTATDRDNEAVPLVFNVMVGAPPVVNRPPSVLAGMVNNIESLQVGGTEMLTLSMYFTDPDEGDTLTYDATSGNTDVATVSRPDDMSMITITAASVGRAMITVTADDGTNDAVSEMFYVTVTAVPNMPPREKKPIENRKVELPASVKFDLSDHFEDPEKGPLYYAVMIVSQSPTDTTTTPASKVIELATGYPDGTNFDAMLEIKTRNPGSATVKVVARDAQLAPTERTFMITVVATGGNAPPSAKPSTETTGVIADFSGIRRLKVGATKPVIDNKKISEYFSDNDFPSEKANARGDTLTFTVKSYKHGTTEKHIVNNTTNVLRTMVDNNGKPDNDYRAPLAADKAQVSASFSRTTWNGDAASTFILSVTAERGGVATADPPTTKSDVVAIIATDEYGLSAVRIFNVHVNHAPKAEGAQAIPKTLSGETDYRKLYWKSDDDKDNTNGVDLVEKGSGYFHDEDGDKLSCSYVSSPKSDAPAKITMTGKTLNIIPVASEGDMMVTVTCADPFEEEASDTLSIGVIGKTFSQR